MNSRLIMFLLLAFVCTRADISEECRTETEILLADENLEVSQKIIFEDYTASYNDVCDLGLGTVDCSIEFEGDERTYRALCNSKGGQLYKREVVLRCAFGAVEYDLGYIPTCVGGSCNITEVRPGDVESEQVDAFLDNLTGIGCDAEDKDGSSVRMTVVWGWIAAMFSLWFGFFC